ncbi:hypothetical protein BDU57DRAFT_15577 [Ampelomyces quisqualis]|uniref:Secreted protein n=1 Tax=Ampelomyces quisqualis TaxID=50730 RepID=A0A6A5QXE4_AMPQU|nr:hypothetical protein BDU57DRAFT_15577 [Ampelomyces quisqualis]
MFMMIYMLPISCCVPAVSGSTTLHRPSHSRIHRHRALLCILHPLPRIEFSKQCFGRRLLPIAIPTFTSPFTFHLGF